jgi:hypothetical protein
MRLDKEETPVIEIQIPFFTGGYAETGPTCPFPS